MLVNGAPTRSIWSTGPGLVQIIDQRHLPHRFVVEDIVDCEKMAVAIEEMHVRGAPLIGVSAAWGMALAAEALMTIDTQTQGSVTNISTDNANWKLLLGESKARLARTRPTAVNLFWALQKQSEIVQNASTLAEACHNLRASAQAITENDVQTCRSIGAHGLSLLQKLWQEKCKRTGDPKAVLQVLTHCNAGWLACVDYGTATAPMYLAHDAGIPLHVWVDETRPRNQGAKLTAWELGSHGVAHTLIPDNAGGHLMQHGMVDIVIVGTDRTTRNGDVANKIGTYLKALAAYDNGIPFYVALPSSTIDWNMQDGVKEIPIETRNEDEVRFMDGLLADGSFGNVLVCPATTRAVNYGFDVTPARLISGLITERGLCQANETGLQTLFTQQPKPVFNA